MAITNRYRLGGKPFERPCEGMNTPVRKLFFLSVEGDLTEKQYFEHLNTWLKEQGVVSVMIHVLQHPKDGCSSLRYVYDLLAECREVVENAILPVDVVKDLSSRFSEQEIEDLINGSDSIPKDRMRELNQTLSKLGIDCDYRKFLASIGGKENGADVFAVIFDRDRYSHGEEDIKELFALCRESQTGCYLSNPCFEFWLALHLFSTGELKDPEELKRILENQRISNRHTYLSKKVSERAGHGKEIPFGKFVQLYGKSLNDAIANARAFSCTFPDMLNNVGTNVHLLVEEILAG